MTDLEVFLQQVIVGLSNGMIIALIALGYTMVYGIVELINFAHGDVFMLGSFAALTVLALCGWSGVAPEHASGAVVTLFLVVPLFTAALNWAIDRYAYRPIRSAPRLAPLVSAIGVSFLLLNVGLFWGAVPLEEFNFGRSAASPKDFPALVSSTNILGDSNILLSYRELLVVGVTVPALLGLLFLIRCTRLGKAMRAVAQEPVAAQLMGVDRDRVISSTFLIGGAMAGVASVVYAFYNNTISFQMGYRVGIDAFTAAVLGGIGSLPGAVLGGIVIGLVRAMSDQYVSTNWTNVVVFTLLIVILTFRPAGLLGSVTREKV